MSMQLDRDYYLARLDAERAAAVAATSEEARAAHQALVGHYLQLLATLEDRAGGSLDISPPANDSAPPGLA